MSLFFKTIAELRGGAATDMARLPNARIASEVLLHVHAKFLSDIDKFVGLTAEVTPEMLEACFAQAFGIEVMSEVKVELARISSEAQRWSEKGRPMDDYRQIFREQLPLIRRTAQMVYSGLPVTHVSDSSLVSPAEVALLAFAILQTRRDTDLFIAQASRRIKVHEQALAEV